MGREAQIHLPGSAVDTPGYCHRRPSVSAPRPFLALTQPDQGTACQPGIQLPHAGLVPLSIRQLFSQVLPLPSHLLPRFQPWTVVLGLTGQVKAFSRDTLFPKCPLDSETHSARQQTTQSKPNSLQKCLQQLGDIGRIMEDNHWPEQKLRYVQLRETGRSAGFGPLSPYLLTLTAHSSLPLGPHYGLG